MTNFFSSIYCTVVLLVLIFAGFAACISLACDIITLAPLVASLTSVSEVLVGDSGASAVGFAGVLGYGELNFRNLERYSENLEDYADQHNPALNVKLAKQMNAQADRLEALFKGIDENPKAEHFGYAGVLPWRERARYHRNIGEAKKAAAIEKAEALREAKEADKDIDFCEGYKDFLATEFDQS